MAIESVLTVVENAVRDWVIRSLAPRKEPFSSQGDASIAQDLAQMMCQMALRMPNSYRRDADGFFDVGCSLYNRIYDPQRVVEWLEIANNDVVLNRPSWSLSIDTALLKYDVAADEVIARIASLDLSGSDRLRRQSAIECVLAQEGPLKVSAVGREKLAHSVIAGQIATSSKSAQQQLERLAMQALAENAR